LLLFLPEPEVFSGFFCLLLDDFCEESEVEKAWLLSSNSSNGLEASFDLFLPGILMRMADKPGRHLKRRKNNNNCPAQGVKPPRRYLF